MSVSNSAVKVNAKQCGILAYDNPAIIDSTVEAVGINAIAAWDTVLTIDHSDVKATGTGGASMFATSGTAIIPKAGMTMKVDWGDDPQTAENKEVIPSAKTITDNEYWWKTYTHIYPWAAPVTGVSLDMDSISLTVDESATLAAVVVPEFAADQSLIWKSDNEKVAMVDADGIVTALSPGSATITVTTVDGNKTASCTVTVEKKEQVMVSIPQANTLTYNGLPQPLVTTGQAANGVVSYALGTDALTVPMDGWSRSVPVAENAGTYTVWYQVSGNQYYKDLTPSSVAVQIQKKPIQPSVAISGWYYFGG